MTCAVFGTVHGRTKEQNKAFVGSCNWKMIRRVKETVKIPVIANGGIETFEDYQRCLVATGADAVMSSEALLENPALFQPGEGSDEGEMLTAVVVLVLGVVRIGHP